MATRSRRSTSSSQPLRLPSHASRVGRESIQQFHITPMVEEQSRTYEGGVAQSFLSERGLLRVSYFHNQYGRQIEPVPATEVPALLPQLSPSEQQSLESLLSNAGDLDLNSQAFRAQGVESEVRIQRVQDFIFARRLYLSGCGGAALLYLRCAATRHLTPACLVNRRRPSRRCPSAPSTRCVGARPFQRPPHTGYGAVSYSGEQYAVAFTAAFASRSDDSTFLGGRDFGGRELAAATQSQSRLQLCQARSWRKLPVPVLARGVCAARQPDRQQENRPL